MMTPKKREEIEKAVENYFYLKSFGRVAVNNMEVHSLKEYLSLYYNGDELAYGLGYGKFNPPQ